MTLAAWAPLHFETPGYLVLLALLPLLVALSIRSLSGLGPVRRWLALAARCLVMLCMILALAGAHRVRKTDELSVIFVLDRSNSVPRAQQQEGLEFVRKSSQELRPATDTLAVIAFDGRSSVEQLPRSTLEIDRISEPTQPDQTNLAAALRMALALFTKDAVRRLVVLSDGNQNVGEALEEAEQYRAAGVPIDVRPLRYRHDNEVVFERLSAPPTATAEETINLRMVLRSQRATSGRILLYHNDQLVDLDPRGPQAGYGVKLDAGPNALTIPVPLRAAGAHRFRAVFEPDDGAQDTIAANNEGRAFTVVSGQGKILILTQGGTDETADDYPSALILKRALERERLVCDVEIAGAGALDQVRLLEYSLVILSNVAAGDFTDDERRGLAVYVRDLGGGLIMVGGDDSFGAGGWMDTPVEEVMPISFDIKSKKQIPKGALVLVMHACEIPQGNYIGERAAVAAVKTLSSRDLVGVLAYQWQGGEEGYWSVPFQEVGDKSRILSLIKKMQMGDLPDLDALMRPGVEALIKRRDAAAKHMIVISDFDPAPPRDDLIKLMKDNKITCSTIAIGYGSHFIDENKARWIAESTGGKFYSTQNFAEIPQIFIKESKIVRRSLISEQPFTPRVAPSMSTLVAGLESEGLPELGGLVLTTPKPLAMVPLVRTSEDGLDPVLAHWQVGLGKAVAFTSGMWPRWGVAWAAWPGFSKVWAQIARWASRQQGTTAFDVSTSVVGGKGHLRVDALDKDAETINFMHVDGALVTPSYESVPLVLTQTGPGRYEAEFDARQSGSYLINLAYRSGRGTQATAGTLQTGLSIAYSPEYRELQANEALLRELAERTQGRLLDDASAAGVFDRSRLQPAESRASIWEDLVRLMLILFLLDVAVRRVAINPLELLRKLRQFIGEIAGARRPAEATAAVLTTLKGTRERVREDLRPATEAGPMPSRGARYEAPVPERAVTEQFAKVLEGATELEAPVVARPTKKAASSTEADFASRLKKAKQAARERLQQDDTPDTGG